MKKADRPKVLLGVCGGIAAYKAAELVRRLQERGCEVRVAITRSATSFIPPLTLEVLSGQAVYEQEYLSPTGRGEESHITAAEWADLICVAPATSHFLARLALGLADDFLTTTALAFNGPWVVAPAMHFEMWNKEALQEHVATLQSRGVFFEGPVEGPLASGEYGVGRMAAPVEIADAVVRRLEGRVRSQKQGDLEGKTVLISAGPTHEPIDPVRYLGNRSSGKMGFALAAEAARRGARTLLVAGPVSLPTPAGVERIDVETALEMCQEVYEHAPTSDLVVMAAAVADFRPAEVTPSKIKKARGVPEIELVANPDILAGLAEVAPNTLRVGFAAETDASEAEARAKLQRKQAELLIWNDVSRSDVGFGVDHNEVVVYRREGDPIPLERRPKAELAVDLFDIFADILRERSR